MEGEIGRVDRAGARGAAVRMVGHCQVVVGPPANGIQRFLQPLHSIQ